MKIYFARIKCVILLIHLLFFSAYEYPIYGTQWHPEKTNFEYNTNEKIPHSFTAIQASQYMANFFVNEARKSDHAFKDAQTEKKYLIYNYTPEHTAVTVKRLENFEQCYFFDNKKQ